MADSVQSTGLPLGDHSTDSVARHTDGVKLAGRSRNLQIQWLRALAATMVMIYHIASYQQLMLHKPHLINLLGSGFGYFGVGLFFAISGYLMSIAIRVQAPMVFLVHRVVRIYPIYILLCALFWIVRSHFYSVSIDPAALLLMPLPGVKYSALTVEWTLVFEVAFYTCLFFLAFARMARWITVIAAGWLAAIVFNSLINPDPGITLVMPLYRMLLSCSCAPMAAGLLLPTALKWRVPLWTLLAIGIAGWAAGEHYHLSYEACRWSFGLSGVCLLWIMLRVSEKPSDTSSGRAGRLMARYGDYSYALYLCHVPIIQMVYLWLPDASISLLSATCLGLALTAAALFGEIDLRLYDYSKRLIKRLPGWPVAGFAIAYAALYIAVMGIGCYQYHQFYLTDASSEIVAKQLETLGPMKDAGGVTSTLTKAGYRLSDTVRGNVDKLEWFGDTGQITLTAWAMVYPRHAAPSVSIAVFRQGLLVASGTPDSIRGDVVAAYHLSLFRRIWTGRDFHYHQGACGADGLVVVAFTPDRQFQILAGPTVIICR